MAPASVKGVFWLLVGFSACAQYDSGALGAFEDVLEGMKLSVHARGIIKASEYVWLPLACLVVAPLFNRRTSKTILLCCAFGSLVAIAILTLAPRVKGEDNLFWTLFASRSLAGVCHSGIAVFGNVWVDRHAPPGSAGSWMGLMNASSLLGLMVGFGAAGLTSNWVATFLGNVAWFALVLLCLLFVSVPTLNVTHLAAPRIIADDIEAARQASVNSIAGASSDNPRRFTSAISEDEVPAAGLRASPLTSMAASFVGTGHSEGATPLLDVPDNAEAQVPTSIDLHTKPSWPIYFLMGLAVSSLFFVSSGLQFWVTPYMEQLYIAENSKRSLTESIQALRQDAHRMVVLLVMVISLTAPILGVIVGGCAVDAAGGWATVKARKRALVFLVISGLFVTVSGVFACFTDSFWLAAGGFWAFDALGSALLPGAMGIMLGSVKKQHRNWASAGSQIMINILGMAGGAFIPALFTGCEVASASGASECDYQLGLRSLLVAPIVGSVSLLITLAVACATPGVTTQGLETEVELPQKTRSRTRTRGVSSVGSQAASTSLIRVGVINQADGQAGTMSLEIDPTLNFAVVVAKAAMCIGLPVRRLFLPDGTEIKSSEAMIEAADFTVKDKVEAGKAAMALNIELISTDGLDFRWKYGDSATYKFGDFILRPVGRLLAGQRAGRNVIHPPQPRSLPLSGNLKDCLPDLWKNCFTICEKLGPLVKLRIFDDVVYICSDPETVDIINQVPDKRLPRTVFGIKTIACDGVFIADGQRWDFARQTLQGSLTPEAVFSLVPAFSTKVFGLVEELGKREAFKKDIDVFEWVERMTMDVICDVGFGHNMGALHEQDGHQDPLVTLFDEVMEISINASLYGAVDIFGSTKRKFESQTKELNGMLDDIIAAVRNGTNTGSKGSLIGALMGAKCPLTGRGFDQSELRDQLLTFLVAGHKTTTLLLTWALNSIASHPEVEQKMIDELRSVFEDNERPPTADELKKLRYMDMVIREVLRLCSPVQVAQRGLTQPVQAGKYTLLPGGWSGKGNSWVAIHIMGISRSKKYWGETHMDFIPERFEPANVAKFHPFQYIPFGGGRRLCIGNLFAITQAKTALCVLMRKYHLRTVPNRPPKIDPNDLATPLHAKAGGGVWLKLIPRTSWDMARPPTVEGPTFSALTSEVPKFDAQGRSMLILWCGEFGTTKTAAEATLRIALSLNFKAVLKQCDDVLAEGLVLKDYNLVLGLISTYNGNPAVNAVKFTAHLQASQNSGEKPLEGVDFAILGAGNANWISTYVKIGRLHDMAFEKLGGNRLVPFEVADKNDNFEEQLEGWQRAVFARLGAANMDAFQGGLQYFEAPKPYLSVSGDLSKAASSDARARAKVNETDFFSTMSQTSCEVETRQELCSTPPLSDKYRSVQLLKISLPEGTSYLAGDHLEVLPTNPSELVLRACRRLNMVPEAVMIVSSSRPADQQESRWQPALGKEVLVSTFLAACVDLTAVPSTVTLAGFLEVAKNEGEAETLRKLIDRQDRAAYERWAEKRLNLVEALEMFPSVDLTIARLSEIAGRLEPRLYSIASSPRTCDRSVELAVGIVRYETEEGLLREGLCSTMLSTAKQVRCRVRAAPHMRLPEDPSVEVACVCGGTGIAPFLGFLEERAVQKKEGAKVAPITLYFGCRAEYDCLKIDRLRALEAEGVCKISLSYSRLPGKPREYVYDALRRDGPSIAALLDPKGQGRFYLCGSASGLGKDCTTVLGEILGKGEMAHGLSLISELQTAGRIIFDVWG